MPHVNSSIYRSQQRDMKVVPHGGPTILQWPKNYCYLALYARCMWTDTHICM